MSILSMLVLISFIFGVTRLSWRARQAKIRLQDDRTGRFLPYKVSNGGAGKTAPRMANKQEYYYSEIKSYRLSV